jgi:hypothetical protein
MLDVEKPASKLHGVPLQTSSLVSSQQNVMGEGPDTLLSELCAICHTNPLKYRCPRCGIQTCSLACVKRHKLWSQCSGIRNPAAYRKRNELATPASVDQDYNFITSIERSLARADDEAAERGIDLATGARRKFVKGQARSNIEIANSGAIVLKAPEGMSRNRQNKTRWNMKYRYLSWTIEWVLPDGSKSLANAQAARTVGEAFMHTVGGKVLRKRKRTQEDAITQPRREDLAQEPQDDWAVEKMTLRTPPAAIGVSAGEFCPQPAESETMAQEECPKVVKEAKPGHNLLSDLNFYLHCPNTPSTIKSLIPINPNTTIADVVKERLLLEFPTIFILYDPPEMLPEPFILEADYAKQYGDQAASIPSTDEANGTTEKQDQDASQIDERRLIEVLRKDLSS